MSDVTHVSLVAAFNRDGMLLLGRRLDNGRWTVAGGHAEEGEDPDKCAVRELYEEAGLKAKKLTRLDQRELRNGKLVITTYRAEVEGKPTGKNDPDRECDEWHFVDVSDGVPKNIAECMAGPKDPTDNVILDLFGLRKSERLWGEPLAKKDYYQANGYDTWPAGKPYPTAEEWLAGRKTYDYPEGPYKQPAVHRMLQHPDPEIRARALDYPEVEREHPNTPEFHNWFNGSQVVDHEGKPRIVFHGTRANFSSFDPGKLGAATDAPSARLGFFFSGRTNTANDYTNIVLPHEKEEHNKLFDEARKLKQSWSRSRSADPKRKAAAGAKYKRSRELYDQAAQMRQEGGNIMPVYLSLKNPYHHDMKGQPYRDQSYHDIIQHAKANGHDSAIIHNTFDATLGDALPDNIYVAFHPHQIKSAIGNQGTYDPNNPEITKAELTKGEPATAGADGSHYPMAGKTTDGLQVGPSVSNMNSIPASLDDYTVHPGVREVPMSEFNTNPHDLFYAADDHARARKLAEAIRQSGRIDPLIVVHDSQGPYVLEGAHRLAALHHLGKKTFPALVVRDDAVEKTESGAIDLQKVQSTPTLPKLGYPDNRRETPIINTRTELNTKAAAAGAMAARLNRHLDPEGQNAARWDSERGVRTGNAGAVHSLPGRKTGHVFSYAKGTPLLEEMFEPGEFRGHRAHPNSPMGTKHHEDFHMMLGRTAERWGRANRQRLAHNLFYALPKNSRHVLDSLNRWRSPQNEDNPEEKLANLFNYLNNPGDRKAFAEHLNQQWPSMANDTGFERHYNVALKRAFRHLQGAMGAADESWVLKDKPWAPEFQATPYQRVRYDSGPEMMKSEPTLPPEYELLHQENPHDHPERYNVWVTHKPTGHTVGEAQFSTHRQYEDENGEPYMTEVEDEYAPGGKRTTVNVSGIPVALKGWDVKVHSDHRRRGLGTAMYQHASKVYGLPIAPGNFQTPDGAAFLAGLKKDEGGEIDRLLQHPDPVERGLALKLHGVEPRHLMTALDDPEPENAEAALGHSAANEDVLAHALTKPSMWQTALEHHAMTPDLLCMAYNESADDPDLGAGVLSQIINHHLLNSDVIRYLYDNGVSSPALMSLSITPQDVRDHAATNGIDGAAQAALVDASPEVVENTLRAEPSALSVVAARYSAVPETVATDLIRRGHVPTDEHQSDLRRALIQNPSVSADVVKEALKDIEPSVRMLARLRLGRHTDEDVFEHGFHGDDSEDFDEESGNLREVPMSPETIMAEWSYR